MDYTMNRIYMDYAATTYVKDEVLEEMMPYWKQYAGNASALYQDGRMAARAVEHAREQIASLIGAAKRREIYFTACGTESDNWALKGVMEANRRKGKHFITTAVEHHAVLHTAQWLKAQGYEVTILPVDENGLVSAKQVKEALRPDTVLVSVIYANNEVGSINSICEIGRVVQEAGVYLHTDAVQAAGNIPIDVVKDGIDLLSFSAHKFYGPKGVGMLYIREGIEIAPLLHGGAQERARRAGTENVPGIVGMAKALELAVGAMPQEQERLRMLRDYMIKRLEQEVTGVKLHGHREKRLSNNINITLAGIPSEASLIDLDLAGIQCSSGSACTSGAVEPSHVLLAMGVPVEEAKCALRFTIGAKTSRGQVDTVISRLKQLTERLAKL